MRDAFPQLDTPAFHERVIREARQAEAQERAAKLCACCGFDLNPEGGLMATEYSTPRWEGDCGYCATLGCPPGMTVVMQDGKVVCAGHQHLHPVPRKAT